MKDLARIFTACAPSPIVGVSDNYNQILRLEASTLSHVYKHRQISPWTSEAGGQLFGLVEEHVVRVTCATGPYRGDERSRFRYRSNPAKAQQTIDARAQEGLLYLGEWHTHAEKHPSASSLDSDAMQRLLANSRLNCSALLMLIVGQVEGPKGLAILSVELGNAQPWNLSTIGIESSHLS